MQVVLTCVECNYQEIDVQQKELMNKISMWNHVKKTHPSMAKRIMRIYPILPSNLFGASPAVEALSW